MKRREFIAGGLAGGLAFAVGSRVRAQAAPGGASEAEKLALKLARQIPTFGTGKAGLLDLSASNSTSSFLGQAGFSFQTQENRDPLWESGKPFSFVDMTPKRASSVSQP